jgi:hypothetical protein
MASTADVLSQIEQADEAVEYEYAALFFLGPAGFRHFLPAYMSMSFALRFSFSKFALFDDAQRKAGLAFLEVKAGHEDVDGALERWRSAVRGSRPRP